ncbi:MAG: AIR synthase related protein, partial [Beijerinckiaceae bacterium]|nr:AIR synthase related protein [Beijerinckiaceae bacterium]
LGNTVQPPGGDAAVIRLGDGPKGLALTADVTQRYCAADPYEGGKQAVAEAWRNLTAVGALPRAITDNLNFGNPEKPEIMGELIRCVEGIGEACRALDFPVVSGNVSLYNETSGCAIPPTPAIGGVGLIEDVRRTATVALKRPGEKILLIGKTGGWLGQSLYAREICGCAEGAPPPVDLAAEKLNGDFVRGLIAQGKVTAVHDISDGGLAVALAEMAMAGAIGASVKVPPSIPERAFLFGEDQARYIVTAAPGAADGIHNAAKIAGAVCEIIGLTGGDTLTLGTGTAILLSELTRAHEEWLPRYMAGESL